MRVIPVILCGGSGTRLWPASTAIHPKQFLQLLGDGSTFQEAVLRTTAIPGADQAIVVAGEAHLPWIQRQLRELRRSASVVLEPQARDSGPAIAAAAAIAHQRDPDAVVVVVSADAHIPELPKFLAAIAHAVSAAQEGSIVTLGVRPTHPETGFGYIRPAEEGAVARVAAFVEKPDQAKAQEYLQAGYLWNTGMFIARAQTLLDELQAFEPEIAEAAKRAVFEAEEAGGALKLGPSFRSAPKVSIDYAVMERTSRAAVVPTDFRWTDLGSWQAVWAAAPKDADENALFGDGHLIRTQRSLVRAAAGQKISVIGLSNVAVVVETGGVLVASLDASQDVKLAAERHKRASAEDGLQGSVFGSLEDAEIWLSDWLRTSALPLWSSLGYDHLLQGYHEELDERARPTNAARRIRVQARQSYVFAKAERLGLPGPWRRYASLGWEYISRHYRRPDGFYRAAVSPVGDVSSDEVRLYDQAFVLLSLAELYGLDPVGHGELRAEAEGLIDRIGGLKHLKGYRENGATPFQANAQMHLLEAALAWMAIDESPIWRRVADEIVHLASTALFDGDAGVLYEVFTTEWRPVGIDLGQLVEPGHQFEWAWLLNRYQAQTGQRDQDRLIDLLYAAGLKGVCPRRGVIVDQLSDRIQLEACSARLWPQTEWVRAACVVGSDQPDRRLAAANALAAYLNTPVRGLWFDKIEGDSRFSSTVSPASSLYHIIGAIEELTRSASSGPSHKLH